VKNFTRIQSEEFSLVYRLGKKWYCDGFIIFYLKSDEKKMAVVASKKVGKAVARNRAKRVLRALFFKFENKILQGKYILVAKDEIKELPFARLEKNLKWGFKKIECLK